MRVRASRVAFRNLLAGQRPYRLGFPRFRRDEMSSKFCLRAGTIAVLSLALSTTLVVAQEHGHGHEKHDRDDDDHDRDHDRGGYSDHDRDAMRGWYHEQHEHLPPGLAK